MPTENIDIKQYDQEIKDNLIDSSNVGNLTEKNENTYETLRNKNISSNIDFTDTDKYEIISKPDGSFLIAQKIEGDKLKPLMTIQSKEIMIDFIKYVFNKKLRKAYKEINVDIQQGNVIIEEKKALAELADEVYVKEVSDKIKGLDQLHDDLIGRLKEFKGMSLLDQNGKEVKINAKMLKDIVNAHFKNVKIINDDIEYKTGLNSISGDYNPEKAIAWIPAFSDTLIRQKSTLMDIAGEYNNIWQFVSDPEYMRGKGSIIDTGIDFGLIGAKETKKFNNKLAKRLDWDEKQAEQMLKLAESTLTDDDYKKLISHLDGVAQGTIDPITDPFVPDQKDKVQDLINKYPSLKLESYLNIGGTSSGETGSINGRTNVEGGAIVGGAEVVDQTLVDQSSAEYKTWLESFSKGGISGLASYGLLENTNMTPEMKKTWKGVGNVAITAGMVYVGWKMVSSAWKLLRGTNKGDTDADKKARSKSWAWLLGPAAIIYGANAIGGESPMKFITGGKINEKIGNFLGGLFGGEKGAETGTETEQGITGVTAMFSGMKYSEISPFIEEKDGVMKIKDEQSYNDMLAAYEAKDNKVAVEFLKSIGKDDEKNLMHLGLTAMGINSHEDLTKTPDASFSEKAADAIVRIQSVSDMMTKEGYDNINPDKMDLVEEYISDKDSKIDDLYKLEARGDVFEKDAEKIDKTGNEDKIKEIANDDAEKEEAITRALNKFHEYMPAAEKKITISGTWPNIKFETYGETTTVNLDKTSIDGLAEFSSYLEAFKVASLTNFIKKTFKGKQANSLEPFTVSSFGKDVEFDDTKTRSFGFDTEVVSGGPGGALKDISPKLEIYKEDYVKYLNKEVEYKRIGGTTTTRPINNTSTTDGGLTLDTNPA